MLKRALVTTAALALASAQVHADQILGPGRIDRSDRVVLPGGRTPSTYQNEKVTATPDKLALSDTDGGSLSNQEVRIDRPNRRLIFKNTDGSIGYGSMLNASPAGRNVVERGDGSGLTGITSNGLDPQAVASVQVSPRFCPYGQLNGVDSNNACVQSAIDYACSLVTSTNGTKVAGNLVFGRANYRLTGVSVPKACAGLNFVGQGSGGPGGTNIYSDNGCTAPIINFYPDATANYVFGGGVRDIHFYNNKPFGGAFDRSTSCLKPLIQANFGRDMVLRNLTTVSPYVFIRLVAGLNYLIDGVGINVALPNSPGIFDFFGYGSTGAADSPTRQDVINLNNVVFFGSRPTAAREQYARGIWWHGFSASLRTNNTAFTAASTALKVDCTVPGAPTGQAPIEIGACPTYGIFNDFETEAAGSNAIDITDAQTLQFNFLYAASYARTSTANPWTSGGNTGVRVKNTQFSTTGGVTVNGGQINNAQGSGIDYEGYQLTVMGGTKIYGNNAANVGASNITIEAPVSGKASGSHLITGNFFCSGPANNGDGQRAVNSLAGNDYVVFTNNILRGCGFADPGTVGTHGLNKPNAQ